MIALWFALPIYVAIGVILWRGFPQLRDTFCELADAGVIVFTIFWPLTLVYFAMIMTMALLVSLLDKLFEFLRRK